MWSPGDLSCTHIICWWYMSQHCCRNKHPHTASVWPWGGPIIAAWVPIMETERWRQRPSSPTWLWCHMSPLAGIQQPWVVSALSGVLDTWGSFRLMSVSSSWRTLETFMPGAAWDQQVFDTEKRRLGGRWQSWPIWRDGHGTEELDSLSPSPRVGN